MFKGSIKDACAEAAVGVVRPSRGETGLEQQEGQARGTHPRPPTAPPAAAMHKPGWGSCSGSEREASQGLPWLTLRRSARLQAPPASRSLCKPVTRARAAAAEDSGVLAFPRGPASGVSQERLSNPGSTVPTSEASTPG